MANKILTQVGQSDNPTLNEQNYSAENNQIAEFFNVQSLLWLALILALAGSLKHLALPRRTTISTRNAASKKSRRNRRRPTCLANRGFTERKWLLTKR